MSSEALLAVALVLTLVSAFVGIGRAVLAAAGLTRRATAGDALALLPTAAAIGFGAVTLISDLVPFWIQLRAPGVVGFSDQAILF